MCGLTSKRPVVGLTELNEFGCKFGRYFYRCRCNCSCLTFAQIINMRDRTFRDRLDTKFRGGNGPSQFVYFQSCFESVNTVRSRDTV